MRKRRAGGAREIGSKMGAEGPYTIEERIGRGRDGHVNIATVVALVM